MRLRIALIVNIIMVCNSYYYNFICVYNVKYSTLYDIKGGENW